MSNPRSTPVAPKWCNCSLCMEYWQKQFRTPTEMVVSAGAELVLTEAFMVEEFGRAYQVWLDEITEMGQ